MTMAYALNDSQVMIARYLRRSLRDPEAFFTALMLPVILMLLFVYVFGGAINNERQVRRLRRARTDRAVRRSSARARPRSRSPPT